MQCSENQLAHEFRQVETNMYLPETPFFKKFTCLGKRASTAKVILEELLLEIYSGGRYKSVSCISFIYVVIQ